MPEQLSPAIRRQLKNLYHLSPLVWAVVRGCDDAELIAQRLAKPLESIEKGISSAVQAGLLGYHEGRIIPLNRYHRDLYHGLHPKARLGSSTPIVDMLGNQTLTTTQIAEGLGRNYHSTYKTLQRMQVRGILTRVDKRWCLA